MDKITEIVSVMYMHGKRLEAEVARMEEEPKKDRFKARVEAILNRLVDLQKEL